MNTWRNVLVQHFPEFGHQPKSWELSDAATHVSSILWKAASTKDGEGVQRVVRFLLWAAQQSEHDRRFCYLCEDTLRKTLTASDTRQAFAEQLDERTLGRLKALIEYVTSREQLVEVEKIVHVRAAQRRSDTAAH